MELRFVGVDMFEAASERRVRCAEERFVVKAGVLGKVGITPGMSVHEDLTVLGGDWIPARANGVATLEQMTHTPYQYLGKARLIESRGGRHYARDVETRRLESPALLVGGSLNYYHWLIDNLPRLLMARRYGELEGRQVLLNHDLTAFAADALRMLDIDESRWTRVDPGMLLQGDEICVPNMLAAATVVHPAVPGLIREAFSLPRAGAGGGRRIYLSRQDAPTRKLMNEDALSALLAQHGFERHTPANMTFAQQMDASAEADIVVAVHGAALANMLFCRPGTRVIEIFSPAHPASFFVLLAHVCGVRHEFVPAALVDADPAKSPLHHQWEVDLAAMEAALRG